MKKLIYLFFVFLVLIMSWDISKGDIAIAAQSSVIPDDAIRLRIIANSDTPEDQWIKRKIRDAVTEKISPWVSSLSSKEEAKIIIQEHLPELEQIVKDTLEQNGFLYEKQPKVELGIVPFPTKLYGQIVYPAGEYETLRISLGNAEGQNWWCVLFPPLCFIDISSGDAVTAQQQNQPINLDTTKDVEVRFFLFEVVAKIISFFKGNI